MLIGAYYAEKDSAIPVVCHNIVVRFRMRQYRQKHPFGENRETAGAVCRNMAESLETDYADNHGNHESQGLNLSEFSIKISSDEKNILFQM